MFWIFGRKDISKKEAKERVPLSPLYTDKLGLENLSKNDSQLRVYVPTTVYLALEDMTTTYCVDTSTYLREFFIVYLYGAHELERMRVDKSGLFYEPPPINEPNSSASDSVMFSRSAGNQLSDELGKNVEQIKIFLPIRIKTDLQTQADLAKLKLSHFVREILIAHLLGHAYLKNQNIISKSDALDFELLD